MTGDLIAYVAVTAALVITPGATTAVVVRNTLTSGQRGGLAAAAGAAIGNTTHAVLAALGGAFVLATVPRARDVVQLLGGLFLLWLAWSSARRIWSGSTQVMSSAASVAPEGQHHRALREGIGVNLLNPAIITFYLSVVPSFLPVPMPAGRYAVFSAIHISMAFVTHCFWVTALHRMRVMMARPGARLTLEVITACALALLAVRVLWSIGARD